MKLNDQFFKPQIAVEKLFIEGSLQNYNLSAKELNKYLFKVYDASGERYGDGYLHNEDFNTDSLRVLNLGTILPFDDYDNNRITIFIDEHNVIVKAYRG